MAMCASSLVKNSFLLLSSSVLKNCIVNAKRQLYSPVSMGINGYLNAREFTKTQFHNVDNVFRNKMLDFVDKQDSMIFTEDLKTMMHIVEKTPEDVDLLLKMMKKFHSQSNLRFGSFVFGTVAMRAFYHLDEPDVALKAFLDPELNTFFDQIMSYQILMDLLYNHGKYEECRHVYDIIKTKNVNGVTHPKNPFIICMGACYKENTKESLNYALNLFQELQERGFLFPRRAVTYIAALALQQDAPHIALEITSLCKNIRYIDIRCIRVVAQAKLKRFDEILIHLRSSLLSDEPTRRKESYFKDTFDQIEKAVTEEGLENDSELVKMLNQLKLHDFIQEQTLDQHLSEQIESIKPYVSDQKAFNEARATRNYYSYQRMNNRSAEQFSTRPGLKDMV